MTKGLTCALKAFMCAFLLIFLCSNVVYAASAGKAYVYSGSSTADLDLYFVAGAFLAAIIVGCVVFAVFYLKHGSNSDF